MRRCGTTLGVRAPWVVASSCGARLSAALLWERSDNGRAPVAGAGYRRVGRWALSPLDCPGNQRHERGPVDQRRTAERIGRHRRRSGGRADATASGNSAPRAWHGELNVLRPRHSASRCRCQMPEQLKATRPATTRRTQHQQPARGQLSERSHSSRRTTRGRNDDATDPKGATPRSSPHRRHSESKAAERPGRMLAALYATARARLPGHTDTRP